MTSGGIKYLARLPLENLDCLEVVKCKIPSFKTVSLADTKVSSGQLEELSALRELSTLHQDGTRVDDSSMRKVATWEHLRWLSLKLTKLRDAGITHLADHKRLVVLNLIDTRFTGHGEKLPCVCTIKLSKGFDEETNSLQQSVLSALS